MSWTAGTTRATGDLISAADWNSFLGSAGSLMYLKTSMLAIKTPTGTKDDANKVFTLPSTPATEVLGLLGSTLLIETDATWGFTRSGVTVTLGSSVPAPSATDNLRFIYGEA